MAQPGEIGWIGRKCPRGASDSSRNRLLVRQGKEPLIDCLKVLQAGIGFNGNVGWYIISTCPIHGEWSREGLEYYRDRRLIEEDLKNDTWKRRDTNFHPGTISRRQA